MNVVQLDGRGHRPHDHQGSGAGVDIAVGIAVRHEHRLTSANRVDALLHPYLAATFEHV